MDTDDCRRILSQCLPMLAPTAVRYLAQGWDSTVFLVDGSLIARFPKRHEVAVTLEREARLLPELAPMLPVPIPQFLHVVRGCTAFPLSFVVYEAVPGTPVDQAALDADGCGTFGRDIAAFLRSLHSFPVDRAAACGVEPATVAGGRGQLHNFRTAVDVALAPLITPGACARLQSWFDDAEAGGIFDWIPTLIHGDLSPEHMLVDPANGVLTGVIDWGDAGIGDPALDFAGLLGLMGEAILQDILGAYGTDNAEAITRRARFYRDLAAVHQLLFGVTVGDRAFIERGVARLRSGIVA